MAHQPDNRGPATPNTCPPNQDPRLSEVFCREQANPILTLCHLPFRASAVLNPGATLVGDETLLLVRVEDIEGYSALHVARSANGVDGWRIEPEPLMSRHDKATEYEEFGCEDPRITYVPDEQRWYITYVAYSAVGPAVGVAVTEDFETVTRVSLLGPSDDKDGAILPHKFEGRWAMLHRPAAGGTQYIWTAYSPDLVHWGEPHCLLREQPGAAWDGVKVGTGPPPVRTDQGWLLIYHGVKSYGGHPLYRMGLALLDADTPHKLIARFPGSIFQPEAPYERQGAVPNVVFPTGAVVRGDELWLYYGAADTCVCLARARIDALLGLLASNGVSTE